jgi:methylated-DNA-[protein]-cysteine S-methyltransferase
MSDKSLDKYAIWVEDQGAAPDSVARAADALYAAGPDEDSVQKAQRALAGRLEAELPPTIYYDIIEDTPFSPIYLAAGPHGLVSLDFGVPEGDFLAYVRKQTGGEPRPSAEAMAGYVAAVRDYVLGKTQDMPLTVDLRGVTPFQRQVLEEARRVPRGQVSTYGDIARRIGKPRAFRAVGQALRRNPVPIVVPCHRVVASDGTLGGYGGKLGNTRKIQLLKLEGVVFA